MAASVSGAPAVTAQFLVLGKDDKPLEGAEIYVYGSLMPAVGVTNSSGQATLSVLGDTPQSIRAIHVKAKSDHWSFYQSEPVIDTSQPNIVSLKPLSDSFPDFPGRQVLGWGERIMRLDQLPQERRGQGVKIAIIDSGVATTHEDLSSITKGYDVTSKAAHDDGRDWQVDTLSHGSHCAGLIAGHSTSKMGIVGFAPAAEIHVCKIFPGAQISQLIDALEYCVEQQIDIVNLSLGIDEPSEVLEQQIARVTSLGVACIVAAGNTGGPVQYPASSPNVLAVAAIGRMGEFPPDSSHAQSVQRPGAEGFFSPRFTCFGPEIAVCAPGVAILSSVPPNNFAAWDGTSMAASHVSGVAALVLAHHPDFAGAFKPRNAQRVARLFQILKASARPLDVGDPRRTGFGVPDVPTAITLQLGAQPVSYGGAGAVAGSVGQPPSGGMYPFFAGSMAGGMGGGMAGGAQQGFGAEPLMAALAQQMHFGGVGNEAGPWGVGVWARRTGWS
jgi:subtilisin family serine protease